MVQSGPAGRVVSMVEAILVVVVIVVLEVVEASLVVGVVVVEMATSLVE